MTTDPPNDPAPLSGELRHAVLDALDRLLGALAVEPLGGDRFRASAEPGQFDHVFGGQLVAQSLMAAGATVGGQDPQSVHASFVQAGDPGQPLDLTVERVRDGRSISTRRVSITQGERTLLVVIASFHSNPSTPELSELAGPGPGPDELPLLQHWVAALPPDLRERGRSWIERPPPIEMRIGEPPSFLGGGSANDARLHWMRVPRTIGDDPLLHAALLAHASDYLLLDMLLRALPERPLPDSLRSFSLDHALWLHRPFRFDRWHRYTQEMVALSGHRGLVRGALHDADGHLVATTMQEGLVRPTG